jgi:hypothetical protein
MKASEKDVRSFYAKHTKEELRAEIIKDQNRLNTTFRRIRDKNDQESVESRITILKDMMSKL